MRHAEAEDARVTHSTSAGGAGNRETVVVYGSRVWWSKPNCWREDRADPGGTSVRIACHGVCSDYIPLRRTLHTTRRPQTLSDRLESLRAKRSHRLPTIVERVAAMALLSPSWGGLEWEFQIIGEEMYIGRNAVRATARWVGEGGMPIVPFIDRYDVLVDRERGVLLRCSGLVDDQPAVVHSARTVQFDVAIPPEVFDYRPPAGTRIVWCTASRTEHN